MRVASVLARSDVVGGANVYVRELSLGLLGHGIKSHVFVGGNGPFVDDLVRHGIPHTTIPSLARSLDPVADLSAYRALRSAVHAWDPDVIAAHTAKAGALMRIAARTGGTPVVYTPHGWSFFNGERGTKVIAFRLLERRLGRLPATIVHVSESERELADRHRLGLADDAVVIPNGVPDVPESLRANPARQPAKIVSVARFEPPKQQAALINALSEVRDHHWTLDLVGDGPLLPSAKRLAKEQGLQDRIRFHGFCADVAPLLASSQIFALITRAESMPLTVLEALRANLPVVASAVGGINEVLRHDVEGLLVRDGDHDGLVRALRQLLQRPERRAAMGAAGRARYVARFTHEQMVAQVAALYGRVTNCA